MSIHSVHLVDATTGRQVAAELHDELSAGTLLDIEAQWSAVRTDLRGKLDAIGAPHPDSLHWDWGRRACF